MKALPLACCARVGVVVAPPDERRRRPIPESRDRLRGARTLGGLKPDRLLEHERLPRSPTAAAYG